jgi:hypothetical protein
MRIRLDGWQRIGIVLSLILLIGFAGHERYVWSDSAEQVDQEYTAKMDQTDFTQAVSDKKITVKGRLRGDIANAPTPSSFAIYKA